MTGPTIRLLRFFVLTMLGVAVFLPEAADARFIRIDLDVGSFPGSDLAGDSSVLSDIFTTIETADGTRVAVPFSVNFFGTTYDQVYINENGVISFGSPFAALPGEVPDLLNAGVPLIAAFFADADMGTAGGVNLAFTVPLFVGGPNMFIDMTSTYHGAAGPDPLINFLQIALIDISGTTGDAGDFRLELNYDNMPWESGDRDGGTNGLGGVAPRIGFTDGMALGHEVAGSGVNGVLLNPVLFQEDCNVTPLSVGCNDYFFEFRGGLPVGIAVGIEVPEPGTFGLLTVGMFSMLFRRRRGFRRARR